MHGCILHMKLCETKKNWEWMLETRVVVFVSRFQTK